MFVKIGRTPVKNQTKPANNSVVHEEAPGVRSFFKIFNRLGRGGVCSRRSTSRHSSSLGWWEIINRAGVAVSNGSSSGVGGGAWAGGCGVFFFRFRVGLL